MKTGEGTCMNLAVRRVHIREQMNDAPNMQLETLGGSSAIILAAGLCRGVSDIVSLGTNA